ncbi:MAG TPA: hypothetical protein VFN23_05885 [Ktedonobacteraceae bacterium]|nr:hypothetical protein [Ktedonobacteraceae bacterium]
MDELNRFDRPVEASVYRNEEIATLHQKGILSRSEAEALDIIQMGLAPDGDEKTDLANILEGEISWEPSCVAIVLNGTITPVLNLEEIIQRPKTSGEKLAICRQVANIIYDVLVALLDEEGGGGA